MCIDSKYSALGWQQTTLGLSVLGSLVYRATMRRIGIVVSGLGQNHSVTQSNAIRSLCLITPEYDIPLDAFHLPCVRQYTSPPLAASVCRGTDSAAQLKEGGKFPARFSLTIMCVCKRLQKHQGTYSAGKTKRDVDVLSYARAVGMWMSFNSG